ncbi:MAG: type II toxin-antitoxin system VapC family toxin [Anaerolineae bacterium]
MVRAVADTHAVIWDLSADSRLPASARAIIDQAATDGDQVAFSAITLVEIVYLIEKGRIPPDTYSRLLAAVGSERADLTVVPLDETVAEFLVQVSRDRVPDMPDRIIVATALRLGVPLISRDRKIQVSGVSTVW